jgi:hypothetical protein
MYCSAATLTVALAVQQVCKVDLLVEYGRRLSPETPPIPVRFQRKLPAVQISRFSRRFLAYCPGTLVATTLK